MVAKKQSSFMAKITLFAQVIQKLPNDLIKSITVRGDSNIWISSDLFSPWHRSNPLGFGATHLA